MCDSNAMIFDCMYNVEIKIAKRNSIKLNLWDSRIEAAHSKISYYRQNQIDIRITKTIENEFSNALVRVMYEIAENKGLNRAQSTFLFHKIHSRKNNIISKLNPIFVNHNTSVFKQVEDFYTNLSNINDRLEQLRKEKGRKDILPEVVDRKLLAEAVILKNNNRDVTILTDDSDFTEFTKEIKDTFEIKIEPIQ